MANTNNPFGFKPLMNTISGAPCRVAEYGKPAADAQVLSIWDLVAAAAVSDALPGGSPLATAVPGCVSYYSQTPGTTPILGTALNFGLASTLSIHYVIDTIDAIFAAQVVSTTVFSVATHGHNLANVKLTVVGSTTTHISGMQLDTPAVTATLDMRIVKAYNVPPNAAGASAIVECIINRHQLGQQIVGV
jgi:hypothetical protein